MKVIHFWKERYFNSGWTTAPCGVVLYSYDRPTTTNQKVTCKSCRKLLKRKPLRVKKGNNS